MQPRQWVKEQLAGLTPEQIMSKAVALTDTFSLMTDAWHSAVIGLLADAYTEAQQHLTAPAYSRFLVGNLSTLYWVMCNDGIACPVTVELFADGWHAYLTKENGEYTNHKGYATVRKAINAASKW